MNPKPQTEWALEPPGVTKMALCKFLTITDALSFMAPNSRELRMWSTNTLPSYRVAHKKWTILCRCLQQRVYHIYWNFP